MSLEKIPTTILVVAVALIRSDGYVLLQRRRLESNHGGLWEFPGGKVEADETPAAALRREIHEELGLSIDCASLKPLTFASDPSEHPLQRDPYLILLYACTRWTGTPQPLAASEIGWYRCDELEGLPMPPHDVALAATISRLI